ncbi:PD40 domain-containing protein [candidate division KSB1 bacterium]|nr:PD40 domain-containing protein [candidate division KSB1 bacterium]
MKLSLFVFILFFVGGCMEQSVVNYQVELTAFIALVDDYDINFQPCWHPDGRHVVYTSMDASRFKAANTGTAVVENHDVGTQLKMVAIPGLEKTVLISDSSGIGSPHFSPDGKSLVYCSKQTGSKDIWIFDLVTKNRRQISNAPCDEIFPRWSTDGERLAYISQGQLIIVTKDGRLLQNVKNQNYLIDTFCWSTSDEIIYSTVAGEKQSDLWRYNFNNGRSEKLNIVGAYPSFAVPLDNNSTITGPQLAFQRNNDIFQLGISDKTITKVVVSGAMPVYSPDGTRLAYSANGNIKMSSIWVTIDE